jgi:hypothetical protein
MRPLNLDEYHARRRTKLREKLLLWAVGLAGSMLLAAAIVPSVLPGPVSRVSGVVVDKEWRKPYRERHKHSTEQHPARFLVWVANRESVRAVAVDSATWQGLHVGQRSSYRFRDSWF